MVAIHIQFAYNEARQSLVQVYLDKPDIDKLDIDKSEEFWEQVYFWWFCIW